MDGLAQSAKKMFAELDTLSAAFKANVSDLTVAFKTKEGEQCNYHMYTVSNKDIPMIQSRIATAARYCDVEVISVVVHTPTIK